MCSPDTSLYRWGTSVPQTSCAPTSKSRLRHIAMILGLKPSARNRKTFCGAADRIYRQIKPRNIWRLSGWPFIFDDKTRGRSEMTGGRDCTGKFRRSIAAALLRRLNYALVPAAAASGDFNKSDGILSLNLLNVSLSFPRPNRCPRQRKR